MIASCKGCLGTWGQWVWAEKTGLLAIAATDAVGTNICSGPEAIVGTCRLSGRPRKVGSELAPFVEVSLRGYIPVDGAFTPQSCHPQLSNPRGHLNQFW